MGVFLFRNGNELWHKKLTRLESLRVLLMLFAIVASVDGRTLKMFKLSLSSVILADVQRTKAENIVTEELMIPPYKQSILYMSRYTH